MSPPYIRLQSVPTKIISLKIKNRKVNVKRIFPTYCTRLDIFFATEKHRTFYDTYSIRYIFSQVGQDLGVANTQLKSILLHTASIWDESRRVWRRMESARKIINNFFACRSIDGLDRLRCWPTLEDVQSTQTRALDLYVDHAERSNEQWLVSVQAAAELDVVTSLGRGLKYNCKPVSFARRVQTEMKLDSVTQRAPTAAHVLHTSWSQLHQIKI